MEKISIIYKDMSKTIGEYKIIGIMIIEEIELGYIEPKVIFYLENDTIDKSDIFKVLGDFKDSVVNVSDLMEKLNTWAKNSVKYNDTLFTPPFELMSDNKNKTSRNKRIMMTLGIENYERVAINHVGKKIT